MADFNDLDQFLGRYVSMTNPDGESAAGFLVKIHDEVDYIPEPVRSVMLDWGQGFRVGEDTEVDVFPASPDGRKAIQVANQIDVLHEFAHAGGCPDMNCRVRARVQLRALRVWRMKQEDAYWQHKYVRAARRAKGDPVVVTYILGQATQEGAPESILDHILVIAERAKKAAGSGA